MYTKLAPLHLWRLLSLRDDQASHQTIDANIRDGTQLAGTNLWVLMFAIVIASVGLNVNSTAVIIGAMLISPLMGPIIGIGYGAGIQDSLLIRQSLRNLGVFVGISLFTSTLYFLVTPLTEAHSELLARTSPTIWDVLIAFFGGAAGMIGLTRKEKSTLIPGVAIATALMPPLCTAGYGLATGQMNFFLGAFYLFLINGVFIAFATLALVRILHLPQHTFPDEAARLRGRLMIAAAVLATLLPSVYLAYELVKEQVFLTAANRFIANLTASEQDVSVIANEVDAKKRVISLTMIGKGVTTEYKQSLAARLDDFRLSGTDLVIRHPSESPQGIDMNVLKRELQKDLLRNALTASEEKTARIASLEGKLDKLNAFISDLDLLEKELRAQLPRARQVLVTATRHQDTAEAPSQVLILVVIDMAGGVPAVEAQRLKRWLAVRMPDRKIVLMAGKSLL